MPVGLSGQPLTSNHLTKLHAAPSEMVLPSGFSHPAPISGTWGLSLILVPKLGFHTSGVVPDSTGLFQIPLVVKIRYETFT